MHLMPDNLNGALHRIRLLFILCLFVSMAAAQPSGGASKAIVIIPPSQFLQEIPKGNTTTMPA
jgi:hypothetical protein